MRGMSIAVERRVQDLEKLAVKLQERIDALEAELKALKDSKGKPRG
jgi:chaperonin cofactor prefoldin